MPITEDVLMIDPPPPLRIAGIAVRVPRKTCPLHGAMNVKQYLCHDAVLLLCNVLGRIGGELRLEKGAKNAPRNLAFGGPKGIPTMMQPSASGWRKLRSGGSILPSGVNGHGTGRNTTTSDRHRRFVA